MLLEKWRSLADGSWDLGKSLSCEHRSQNRLPPIVVPGPHSYDDDMQTPFRAVVELGCPCGERLELPFEEARNPFVCSYCDHDTYWLSRSSKPSKRLWAGLSSKRIVARCPATLLCLPQHCGTDGPSFAIAGLFTSSGR